MRPIDGDALRQKIRQEMKTLGFSEPKEQVKRLTFQKALLFIKEQPTIEQPTWIPVTERLPDEKQEVLCLTPDGSCRVFGWTYIDWMWFDDNEWWDEKDVTHWMPLPMPPKGDE